MMLYTERSGAEYNTKGKNSKSMKSPIPIGNGKLVQNLAVAAAETILLTGLFLAVDVSEMLWTRHVEKQILHRIVELIG